MKPPNPRVEAATRPRQPGSDEPSPEPVPGQDEPNPQPVEPPGPSTGDEPATPRPLALSENSDAR